MSDAFFHKVFGDSEPTHLGSGWVSGVLGVFFGLLGLGGALCLHFPALLTLPEARSHYPMVVIRLLIQGTIAAAFVLAGLSAILRQRKVLALTAVLLAAVALLLGGGSTPLPNEVGSHYGIGFYWFLTDLLVMTIVFVPVERFWPLHRGQKTFRPEWTTDAFYFVATHLPAQLLTFLMVLPALLLTKWLAIPPFQAFVQRWPYLVQLVAAIFVADLGQYVVHRAFHTVPLLWRFHSIQHSMKTHDWIAGPRSHLIDSGIKRARGLVP